MRNRVGAFSAVLILIACGLLACSRSETPTEPSAGRFTLDLTIRVTGCASERPIAILVNGQGVGAIATGSDVARVRAFVTELEHDRLTLLRSDGSSFFEGGIPYVAGAPGGVPSAFGLSLDCAAPNAVWTVL